MSPEDLAALSNLGLDGSGADGEEPESEEALQGMLEQMMGQLMSKELLHEPLAELVEKASPISLMNHFSCANLGLILR